MAIWQYGFEAGTNGANVSASDASPAFGGVDPASCTYSNAHPAHGSLGMKLASGSANRRVTWTSGSATAVLQREYVYLPSWASVDTELMRGENVGGTAINAKLFVSQISSGKLQLSTQGNTAAATASAAFPLAQLVRLELLTIAGTSSTTGQVRAAYYLGDSTTPVWDSGLLTGQNIAGTDGALGELRFGINGAPPTDIFIDDVGAKTGVDAVWGAWPVVNNPPTVSPIANQTVAASTSCGITISASDTDGTIASYLTTVTRYTSGAAPASVTVTGSTTASPTWTSGAAGSLDVATVTVTDNGGATSTPVTTEVRVLTTNSTVKFLRGYSSSNGTWTVNGSVASAGEGLNDALDTTYVESPAVDGTSVWTERLRCEPMSPRTGLTVASRFAYDVSGSATTKVRVIDGTTQRQENTVTVTTTIADMSPITLASPGAIVDWGFISLEYAVQ